MNPWHVQLSDYFPFAGPTFLKVITPYRKLLVKQFSPCWMCGHFTRTAIVSRVSIDFWHWTIGEMWFIFLNLKCSTACHKFSMFCRSSEPGPVASQTFWLFTAEEKVVSFKIITAHFHFTFQWEKQQTAFLNYAVMVELLIQPNSCWILHARPARTSLFHPFRYLICGLYE